MNDSKVFRSKKVQFYRLVKIVLQHSLFALSICYY